MVDAATLLEPIGGLQVVVATVAVLLLAAYLTRTLYAAEPLPGALSKKGTVALDAAAFAAHDEARRDLGRVFCAKGIYVTRGDGASPQILAPPEGLPSGIQPEALAAQHAAFVAAVERMRERPLSEDELRRLVSHLTVSPTISVLAAVNVPPMLLQNRCVVHISADGPVRAFTIGYIGTPIAATTPAGKYAPFVLVVASSDLRDSATAEPSTLACSIAYSVRKAKYPRIEDEIAKVALEGA